MARTGVLVVDDEATLRRVLKRTLVACDYDVRVAASAEEALEQIYDDPPAAVLLDIVLPGMSGLELLGEIKRISPETEVVMMTSHASVETALAATRHGAYDYLQKPFEDLGVVRLVIERATEKHRMASDLRNLVEETERQNIQLSLAVERLNSTVEISRSLSEQDELDELLRHFVQFLAGELGARRAWVMLLDEAGERLNVAARHGMQRVEPASLGRKLGDGIAGRVAQTGSPFVATDGEVDGVALCVPLRSGQVTLGVACVASAEDGRVFGSEDANYVLALGSHLAAAMDKLKRLEETEKAFASLKSTQEQLVYSERLKVVGQMAAGVAHDFNNLLSVLSGRTQLAKIKLQSDDVRAVQANLDTIESTLTRCAQAVRRIQNFTSSDDESVRETVDVHALIRDAVEMTRPKWKEAAEAEGRPISIEFEFGELDPVQGNPLELTQVVGNLIFNAVEAMPEGGVIRLRTRQEEDRVLLEVEDTGRGMDERERTRLFEPFFSTKPDGQGLGAPILQTIVKRHGGEVTFRTTPGEGTVFRVRIPSVAPSVAPASEPVRERTSTAARVLLVDDDEHVLRTYREALESEGHQVLPSTSGSQALEFFDHAGFDLVVTDLSMPGMSGLELAKRLKQRRPEIPVILLSGWASEYVTDETKQEVGLSAVLEKPCRFEDFLEAVELALD